VERFVIGNNINKPLTAYGHKTYTMKTAMQEMIEIIEKNISIKNFQFWEFTTSELLAKEKQDIIDAYCNGCKNTGLYKTHEEKATYYFTQKYEQ